MKYLATLAFLIVGISSAYADDFGARFMNEAPAALSDDLSPEARIAKILSTVEPAAGDEEQQTQESTVDNDSEADGQVDTQEPVQEQ